MRLYAHASDRMREDLTQARWQESLNARAAINERSPPGRRAWKATKGF